MKRYHPLTPEHFSQIKRRLELMEKNAEVIEKILGKTYAKTEPMVVRAGEISVAIRRLQWAMIRAETGGTTSKPE